MAYLIDLDRIDDNPFQRRSDYGDIAALATDITAASPTFPDTLGLMQIPTGRLVENGKPIALDKPIGYLLRRPGVRVQLAYGHRRRRAFDYLTELSVAGSLSDTNGQPDTIYKPGLMPVEILPLSNSEMLDAVWRENKKRQNPSPIDEARLMADAAQELELTQEQIGERWQLSRSAVANKMRLLQLPIDMQDQVNKGELSERQALAVLQAVQLPEAAIGDYWQVQIANLAIREGMTANNIRDFIAEKATANGTPIVDLLHAETDMSAAKNGEIKAGTCAGCSQAYKIKGNRYCAVNSCQAARLQLYNEAITGEASKATGLPAYIHEGANSWQLSTFHDRDEVNEIAAAGCPEKGLHVMPLHQTNYPTGTLTVEGFDQCAYVCTAGQYGQCPCKKAKAQAERDAADPAMAAKRHANEHLKQTWLNSTLNPVRDDLAAKLSAGDKGAIFFALDMIGYHNIDRDQPWEEYLTACASEALQSLISWSTENVGVDGARDQLVTALAPFGYDPRPAFLDYDIPAAIALHSRLQRIEGWRRNLLTRPPLSDDLAYNSAAVNGNIINLRKLRDEVAELPPDDLEQLNTLRPDFLPVIDNYTTRLQDLDELMATAVNGDLVALSAEATEFGQVLSMYHDAKIESDAKKASVFALMYMAQLCKTEHVEILDNAIEVYEKEHAT